MPRIRYEAWKPRADAQQVIDQANSILRSPAFSSYNLTLRQLYYQFVAGDLIPNTQKSYDRLGDIVSRARLAGLLDWNDITDNTRSISAWAFSTDDPVDVIEDVPGQFYVDPWTTQPRRIEVWVEKDALSNVVRRACQTRDVAYFSCRGYVSSSAMWQAGQRIGRYLNDGQAVTILHLGDHDPSGIDMTRDITERMEQFVYTDWFQARAHRLSPRHNAIIEDIETRVREVQGTVSHGRPVFEVKRIALNIDQIEQYGPPPNPAKMSDARAAAYVEEHGYESWELDSLAPAVLDGLIQDEIESIIDALAFGDRMDETREGQARLQKLVDQWDAVSDFLDTL